MGKFTNVDTYKGLISGGQQEEPKKQRGRNKTQETMSNIVKPENISKPIEQSSEEPKPQKKYLRLDITDCQEYIYLMAQHHGNISGKYVSMTQYILSLIQADKEKNLELYRKLEEIEQLKQELI